LEAGQLRRGVRQCNADAITAGSAVAGPSSQLALNAAECAHTMEALAGADVFGALRFVRPPAALQKADGK
jgi:hypothetical protein